MNTNIIKTMIFAAILWLTASNASAQEIKVRNIAQLTTDISARSAARMDANNKECAIVRVNIPSLKTMDFGNAIVGKAEYNAGEYLLYVPEGTKQIPLSVNGYKESVIDFDQYGVSIEGKNVYRVTLYIDNGKTAASDKHGSMKITTEPESSYLMMDGMPIGETPLTMKDVPVGKHVISFPNTAGYTLSDQTIIINENEAFERHYVLEENKDVFDWEEAISKVGSDNDGGTWQPVKYKEKTVNGKRGVQDYWGNWVVPIGEYEYVDAYNYRLGDSDVFKVGNYVYNKIIMGLYKPGKGLILPCEYDNILFFDQTPENVIKVIKNGKVGLIDNTGKVILPCMYDGISYNEENKVYIVSYGSTKELLDINKNSICTLPSCQRYLFGKDEIILRDGKQTLFLNYKGQIFEKMYDDYKHWGHLGKMMMVEYNGKYGIINPSGQVVVPLFYYLSHYNSDSEKGGIVLFDNKEFIVIDKNEHIYKVSRNDEEDERDGPKIIGQYLRFKKNGKYGLLDQDGKTVLPFEFDRIDDNSFDFITAENNNKTTIYDMSLHELLTIDETDNVGIGTIKDGIILLEDGESNRYGFMNLKGEVLAGCLFDAHRIEEFYSNGPYQDNLIQHGLGLLCIGDRCGFVNKDGEIVIPLIYSIIVPFFDGTVYGLKPDGTWVDLKLEQYNNK